MVVVSVACGSAIPVAVNDGELVRDEIILSRHKRMVKELSYERQSAH